MWLHYYYTTTTSRDGAAWSNSGIPRGGTQTDVLKMLTPSHVGNLLHVFARGWSPRQCRVMLRDLGRSTALVGKSEFSVRVPLQYTPCLPAVTSTSEQGVLREVAEMNETEIGQPATAVSSSSNRRRHRHLESDRHFQNTAYSKDGLVSTRTDRRTSDLDPVHTALFFPPLLS